MKNVTEKIYIVDMLSNQTSNVIWKLINNNDKTKKMQNIPIEIFYIKGKCKDVNVLQISDIQADKKYI